MIKNNPKWRTQRKRLITATECLADQLSAEQMERLSRAMMFNGKDHEALMRIINGGKE